VYDRPTIDPKRAAAIGLPFPRIGAYSFSATMVDVEVDEVTGAAEVKRVWSACDVGRAINPLLVEGQIEGGVAQGIGFALVEEMVWDGARLANPTLMDYKIPTTREVPYELHPIIVESQDADGPFGAKGVGEVCLVPVPAAIGNAVKRATGVRLFKLPLTGERILRGMLGTNRNFRRELPCSINAGFCNPSPHWLLPRRSLHPFGATAGGSDLPVARARRSAGVRAVDAGAARGYYAQEGLKVSFVTAKGGVDVASRSARAILRSGRDRRHADRRARQRRADQGGGCAGRTLADAARRAPDLPITGPKDRRPHRLGLAYQDTTFYAFQGMLASAGLTKNDVDAQAAGPAGVWQLFAARKSDAMVVVPEWAASAREAGAKMRIYSSDDYFKSMAQAILASDETIQKRPELVKKLVRATLRGMQDIMRDPKTAARDYVAAVPQHKGREAFIEEVFNLYIYVYPGQKVLGAMDPERLAALQKFYVKEGIVAKESPIAELYTNQFVQ
jgi:NitT/TauT family transport system substrate-binding protein